MIAEVKLSCGADGLECPVDGGEGLDSVSPTYMRLYDVAHVCAVCAGTGSPLGCGRDEHTPVITLASDTRRRNSPNCFIRAEVTKLRCCFKSELLCLQMRESQVQELNAWLGLELHFQTQPGSQSSQA